MAFPTTTVLDDFNRADGGLGTNWTNQVFPGDQTIRVAGNAMEKTSGGGAWGSSYWNPATFGPDTEVFFTATNGTNGGSIELLARLQAAGTSGVDGYLLDITGSSWSIWKINNNVQTQVGSAVTHALSFGDGIGFELIGTALKGYVFHSGVWTLVISVTDGTVTTGGNIGAALNNTAVVDDFGGGTVASGGTVITAPAQALSGAGSSSGFGRLTLQGQGSLSGAGVVAGQGVLTLRGLGALAGDGSASGSGTLALRGAADLLGSSDFSGVGFIVTPGGTVIIAPAQALTAQSDSTVFPVVVRQFAPAALAALGDASGLGRLLLGGEARLDGQANASGAGSLLLGGAADLAALSQATGLGTLLLAGQGALSGAGVISGSGVIAPKFGDPTSLVLTVTLGNGLALEVDLLNPLALQAEAANTLSLEVT